MTSDAASSHFIESGDEPGLRLHLRLRAPVGKDPLACPPVLLVHGATYASPLYDVAHPGASWLQAIAEAGFAAYALDIRGYGQSRSQVMEDADSPYATGDQALRDIDDAVTWLIARHGAGRVALGGGSWGSITTARYAATIGRGKVERLILYAPIFAERNQGWLTLLADPKEPSRINPGFGACRWVNEETTRLRWDEESPPGVTRRDDAVLTAMFQASLADDPLAKKQTPPAFRAPNGTFLDLWEAFNGRALYDPAAITCPTLLLRGGADMTSTRSDALALFDKLGTDARHYVEIADGGHFVSAENRAPQVFAEANAFLGLNVG
ncbi:alpha/beta fold hydrolase [Hwanghaeella grinnelliae]|uniref:Alpha/beta fold hydrolase n=1 Tax=Hwanghaeella grinnelliae TaxID=2500179 RepID=A0A3S2Z870_9PROT|nr:alpha/beta fold hydrolase [Hwanghaeella grinnelliae]RVU36858.1 alpha/beta fold hydrolase [Hwanghaeella grinnelliae]